MIGYAAACSGPAADTVSSALPTAATRESGDDGVVQIRVEVPDVPADNTTAEQLTVPLNSHVEIVFGSGVSGPVHLRGYERYADTEQGATVLRFVADLPGRFVVERDETGTVLVEVEVFDPAQA